jgi:hypothetical protein
VNSSSPSRARATEMRDCARTASADRSAGTGTTRSGRCRRSEASASSGSDRNWSARVMAIVVPR